jgi:hypothetical protein
VDEWDSNSDNGGVARLARDQPGGTMSTPFQISLAPNQLLQAINPGPSLKRAVNSASSTSILAGQPIPTWNEKS